MTEIVSKVTEIVSKLLLAGYKFMPKIHLHLHVVLVDHLQKTKEE